MGDQVRHVITLKEQEPFSEKKLEESRALLRSWGRFESVAIEKKRSSEGWVVTFNLVPGLIISSIDFTGHFPYLTSRIRRNVGVRIGRIYERDLIIEKVYKLVNNSPKIRVHLKNTPMAVRRHHQWVKIFTVLDIW